MTPSKAEPAPRPSVLATHPQVLAALAPLTSLRTLEAHTQVTSTNDVAQRRLLAGAAPGLVVVADRQTAGRGRAGRQWIDGPAGATEPTNLAVTATVVLPRRAAGLLPLVAGLAVADTFDHAGAASTLKWPNDVLLAGRKACGILVEGHAIGGEQVALIGCGLDLDWRGVTREGEATRWGSLAEALGRPVDRAEVLAQLLRALDTRLDQHARRPEATLADYRARCVTLGQQVGVQPPDGRMIRGVAVDLDLDGHLILEIAGVRRRVEAGDIHHIPPTP